MWKDCVGIVEISKGVSMSIVDAIRNKFIEIDAVSTAVNERTAVWTLGEVLFVIESVEKEQRGDAD